MADTNAPVGMRSPDGRFWWDGTAWQPVPPPPSGGGVAVYQTAGTPGPQRSIGVSILLAIVTLGIYTLVWTYKTHKEIKGYSGAGVGGPVGLVIYILISIVTWFLLPSEMREMHEKAGEKSPVRGVTGFWVLLPILGPFIWFFKVQGGLNRFWAARTTPGQPA
jgi:hypothetical protein